MDFGSQETGKHRHGVAGWREMHLYSQMKWKSTIIERERERERVTLTAKTHSYMTVFNKIEPHHVGFSGNDPTPMSNWQHLHPGLTAN